MTIKEKYELLDRLGILGIGDSLQDFTNRVKMSGEYDEAYQDGMWDLANEIADYLQDENRFDILNDLLYNLLKY